MKTPSIVATVGRAKPTSHAKPQFEITGLWDGKLDQTWTFETGQKVTMKFPFDAEVDFFGEAFRTNHVYTVTIEVVS